MWSIWLRGRTDPARVEAASASEENETLVFTNDAGQVVARFPLPEVQGHSADSDAPDFAIIPFGGR
jgi:hypothetical protein